MDLYQKYKKLLSDQSFPYACLDLEWFDENIKTNLSRAGDKKIRLASKSIRCPELMKRIFAFSDQFQGIMAYHGEEAIYLSQEGFDDILLGYPVMDEKVLLKIGEELRKGKKICCMIDHVDHLSVLDKIGAQLNIKMSICIDIDLSQSYPGLHFGVLRSGINNKEKLELLLEEIKGCSFVELDGLMGYEAQVAGLGDEVKESAVKGYAIRWLKKRAIPKIRSWRTEAISLIKKHGFHLRFINAGGTGSLETSIAEADVSEVTVGSGFYCSHLFDNYRNFTLQPALFYAVQIVRQPQPNIYTCHGGGFVASGGIDPLKEPIVFLPKGGKLDRNEGAGEVQTPVFYKEKQADLKLGDPIFLRHAKAGELCERFSKLITLENEKVGQVFTYRGLGKSFG